MNELRVKNINVGDRIRHTTFGEGLVTKCKPSLTDVMVTIAFDGDNSASTRCLPTDGTRFKVKQFLLYHTPMKIIKRYKSPPEKPEKIKEHKSPHTYTTEFKIMVVKQALSEGRSVVRKHYKLPETTLRDWVKKFDTRGGGETL